ncbi:MAG: SRPBCC family protein [Rhodobacteraceae bacterium]|nr:SRPBCC family protein [Paracoccaceae bacterium]
MKLSTREDIDAPIDHVFARVSDFAGFERAALRRGAEVTRADRLTKPAPGMVWKIAFDWRHKRRQMVAELVDFIPPNRQRFDIDSRAIQATLSVDLIPMSPRRTRVAVELEFRPKTLTARLVVQSLRMTRARQTARFRQNVAAFAQEIEASQPTNRTGPQAQPRPGTF